MRLSAPIHRLKRRARLMARTESIPLNEALDRVARDEGYPAWSLLARRHPGAGSDEPLLPRLTPGDMLLLGARPGQGKTLLGLRLLQEAVAQGHRAVFYTLDYTEAQVTERLDRLAPGTPDHGVEILVSDEIDAGFIARHLADAPRGTVAVIDYLQILDQRRSTPPLSDQLQVLGSLARDRGLILAFIAQIDRRFAAAPGVVPGLADLRLPNPVPDGAFSAACFLHDGRSRFARLA